MLRGTHVLFIKVGVTRLGGDKPGQDDQTPTPAPYLVLIKQEEQATSGLPAWRAANGRRPERGPWRRCRNRCRRRGYCGAAASSQGRSGAHRWARGREPTA